MKVSSQQWIEIIKLISTFAIGVISASSLNTFIESHLTPDVVLLIDTIETFGLTF